MSPQDPALSLTGEGGKKKKIPFGESYEMRDPLEDALEYDAEHKGETEKSVNKLKVQKAHLDIQSAYGDALKAIAGAQEKFSKNQPVGGALSGAYGVKAPTDPSSEFHLRSALERATARKDPIKLADDLQQLGAKLHDSNLITASQKLIRAGQAKAELEGMRKPGGALAIDAKELEYARKTLTDRQATLTEQLKTAGEIRSPEIQKQIAETKKELARIAPAPMKAPDGQQQPILDPNTAFGGDGKGPVTKYMDGLGIDREDLTDRLHETMKIVGIPTDKWDETVDPKAALMRVVGSLDRNGDLFASLVTQGLAAARAEDQASAASAPPPAAGSDEAAAVEATQGRIHGKEAQLRALYGQLAQSPFMHTWPGVILYVLVGMITQNPAFAAKLIGGVGNQDAVDREIKGIQFDLRRLDRELAYRVENEQWAKREAAKRLASKQDTKDDRLWQLGKMMLDHKLMMERAKKQGNPETELMNKLSRDFDRATAMAAKYSKTMNDPFADDTQKANAQSQFTQYMMRAKALDEDLMRVGGHLLELLPDEEEEGREAGE